MTPFEQGYIEKCAEHGVDAGQLAKQAQEFAHVYNPSQGLIGAGIGAGLGGAGSLGYDLLRGQDINASRAILAALAGGGLGGWAGSHLAGGEADKLWNNRVDEVFLAPLRGSNQAFLDSPVGQHLKPEQVAKIKQNIDMFTAKNLMEFAPGHSLETGRKIGR